MPDVCSNRTLGQGVSLVTDTKQTRSTGSKAGRASTDGAGRQLLRLLLNPDKNLFGIIMVQKTCFNGLQNLS